MTDEPNYIALSPDIEHLFLVDPMEITPDDILLLVNHYRATRFNFMKLQDKPRTVEKSRGPALDEAKSKEAVNSILAALMSDDDE